jgi:hypothetical protein
MRMLRPYGISASGVGPEVGAPTASRPAGLVPRSAPLQGRGRRVGYDLAVNIAGHNFMALITAVAAV